MLSLLVGSNALVVPQAPLVPGAAVTARTAAPLMEAGGKLRANSLAERRKMKLETGEGLRVPVAFEVWGDPLTHSLFPAARHQLEAPHLAAEVGLRWLLLLPGAPLAPVVLALLPVASVASNFCCQWY